LAKETEKKSQENQGQEKSRFRPNLKVLLIIIVLLVLVFLLSGVVFVAFRIGLVDRLLSSTVSDAAPQTTVEEPAYTYEVPEIVVNLSNSDSRRFLSVKFYVGYDESKLAEELERRMPEIRDVVLEILWEVSLEDIYSPEGKEHLREEIKKAINDLINSGEIKGVYFWHIMVQ